MGPPPFYGRRRPLLKWREIQLKELPPAQNGLESGKIDVILGETSRMALWRMLRLSRQTMCSCCSCLEHSVASQSVICSRVLIPGLPVLYFQSYALRHEASCPDGHNCELSEVRPAREQPSTFCSTEAYPSSEKPFCLRPQLYVAELVHFFRV